MRLNQVIAIERGIKGKVVADVDVIRKAAEKAALFDGFAKKYRKMAEDGEDVPPQKANVQMIASLALKEMADRWTELLDVTAQKDYANCKAVADVVLDDGVVLTAVPATYLLFLEHQLTELYTVVAAFPTLDPAETWTLDPHTRLHRTEPLITTRTQKEQRAIVLYDATKEHPAQTQIIVKDVNVGTWEAVRYSGALPSEEHRRLLAKIERVQQAVKVAREQANMADAPKQEIGKKVFGWLFQA